MAKYPNENNYIKEIISKCQWRHWPLLLMGENVTTLALARKESDFMFLGFTFVNICPRVRFPVLGSVGKCEGLNSHIPKWAPTLGVRVAMDSWIFRRQFHWSKLIGLKNYLCYWKDLETYMSKMGLHDPFGYLKHKWRPKKGPRVYNPYMEEH